MMNIYKCNDISIEVIRGQTFAISLESIPVTGYTWIAEYDSDMMELIELPIFVPQSPTIGGGGEEIFNFRAKQIGKTMIKMKYKRDWETTSREVRIFEINVIH